MNRTLMNLIVALVLGFGLYPNLANARPNDYKIDGVLLPTKLNVAPSPSPFSGTWIGTWGGWRKTILVVQSVDPNGAVKLIYSVASNRKFKATYFQVSAQISGQTRVKKLTFTLNGQPLSFSISQSGRLRGIFGNGFGFAVLKKVALGDIVKSDAKINWSMGKKHMLATAIVEDDNPIRLETVIFKPKGKGPFPLAIVNHGSTGRGNNEAIFKHTWYNEWFADVLNAHGWIVAFPQRRGRGKSDGLYDEGFSKNRANGYTCSTRRSLAGADRALEDIEMAVLALGKRKDINASKLLLAGNSRGGILSVAYGGLHASKTVGVINFVGGWMGDLCNNAETINQTLFKKGGGLKVPTLWVYGRDDAFYSIDHSKANFAAFKSVGGTGNFVELTIAGKNNGHWAMAIPTLWGAQVESYLRALRR